jgi:uncharacterized protein
MTDESTNIHIDTRAALQDMVKALPKIYPVNMPQVLVYGSWARHEATSASDVDVLLLYPSNVHPGQEIQRLSAILADLNLRYGVLITVLPVYEVNYHNLAGPFWKNVRMEGIPIEAV